jgi:hypothetical protein
MPHTANVIVRCAIVTKGHAGEFAIDLASRRPRAKNTFTGTPDVLQVFAFLAAPS